MLTDKSSLTYGSMLLGVLLLVDQGILWVLQHDAPQVIHPNIQSWLEILPKPYGWWVAAVLLMSVVWTTKLPWWSWPWAVAGLLANGLTYARFGAFLDYIPLHYFYTNSADCYITIGAILLLREVVVRK